MPQSGFTPVQTYSSSTPGNVPLAANLINSTQGAEMAINIADGKLFYKDASGNVQVLASKAGNINVSSLSFGTTGLTPSTATTGAITVAGILNAANGGTGEAGTLTGILYGNGTSSHTVATTAQVLSLIGTLPVSNGGTGQTTFTAGQVLYGNGTSGLSTSANMTFDGTTLTANALKSATLGSPAATALTIQSAGTTAITVDTSQNVGIGTSSPGTKLDVVISQNSDTSIRVNNSNAGSSARANLLFGNNTNAASAGIFLNSSTNTSAMGGANSFNIYQGLSAPITFQVSGVEKSRIDPNGNLLVGVTTTAAASTGVVSAYGNFRCRPGTGGAETNTFVINWTGSPQLWIDTTNIGTLATVSDYRVKRNIQIQTVPALERVMALRPVIYQMANYGSLFKEGEEIKEGFIAHELQEIIPSGVDGKKDDETQIQSLRVDAILSVAVKAIQELNAKVDAQAATIETMQAKLKDAGVLGF